MSRYPLNMPLVLKEEAEYYAGEQGISLNQFILWAVSEKIGGLKQRLEDSTPPLIAHRRGAYGQTAVVRGTGIRVQTLVLAVRNWGLAPAEVAAEYDLSEAQVRSALAYYERHRAEIDANIALEVALEQEASRNTAGNG